MARHPVSVVRSVLGPPAKATKGERFFVHEIARFLGVQSSRVRKFLTDLGMIEWFRSGRPGRPPRAYTTARGVALSVVHFRALQAECPKKGRRKG